MMRILHLIPSLHGGGAERQLAYLAAGLQALACEVHVAVFDGGTNYPLVEAAQATIHRLSTASNYDPRILFKLVRLIRSVRPDVVQTWITQMDVFGGMAALLTGTPWVISERSSGAHYQKNNRLRLRRMVGKHARAVVANSEPGLHGWEDCRGRKLVVPNAVAFSAIEAAPRDTTDFGDAKVILFAGRLGPEKNIANLIVALRQVIAQRNVVALLCGTGALEDEIRTSIAAAGCSDRIQMLGFCENLPGIMKRADMLVAPSWYEGHPNVSIEAAAVGCPLVVSDIPAHRGWLDDESALFAPPENPHALAAAMLKTIDDPTAARRRAERARMLVDDWTVERTSSAYLRVYEEICAARARG